MISGAPFHDAQGASSGTAYIFIRDAAGRWVEEGKPLPEDGTEGALFGRWVAIEGEVAVVGAPRADAVGDGSSSGAAYVFSLVDGAWRQTSRLVAGDPRGGDRFGWYVAIDGGTIVVAASNEGDGGG